MKAPLPPDETQRLEALRQYDVLDTPAEPAFDDLVRLAAHICQTPIAVVVLVDDSRQWFKAKVGLEARETSRDVAFCAHTILNSSEVLQVRDASLDPRFFDNPLVTADPHIRFYAGVPLVTPGGLALGSLCVLNCKPQILTAEQIAALRTLGRQVIAQLELRRHASQLAILNVENKRVAALLQQRFDELSSSKQETDRLLALGEKSRRALLSVLEDEKLTGASLRESEANLASAQQRAKIGSWELPLADKKGFWSAEMFRLFARDPALGTMNLDQLMTLIHPQDRGFIGRDSAQTIAERRELHQEFRVILPDGSLRWIESHAELTYNAAGQPVSLIGTSQDITERGRAEALLVADNQILQMIASGAQLADVLDAIVKNVESASPSALCSVLLLDDDGIHLRHGAGANLPDAYKLAIDGAAIGKNVGSCGTAAYRKEAVIVSDIASDPLWIDYRELALQHGLKACWSNPIKDANNGVLGTFAIYYREVRSPDPYDFSLVDSATSQAKIVIERKQADEALQRSNLLLEASQAIAKIGSWEFDLQTLNVSWSPEHYRIFELQETPADQLYAAYRRKIHPDDIPELDRLLNLAVEKGLGFEFEHRVVCQDGRIKTVLGIGQTAMNGNGKGVAIRGTVQDITERKQMEDQLRDTMSTLEQRVLERTQELQAAQISKTRFFAAASHDLLQPLNAARIFASSLAEQRELSELSVHIVQRIDSALLSAEEVIDVLVDVAKLDTGSVLAVIEDVDLSEILAGLVDQFSAIAERRNLQLRIGPCKVIVRSDRRLLRRVLQNLVSNALRYTASGGVLIGVRRLPGAQIRIDVCDTGPGIPDEAISGIFEEFQRGGHQSPWGEKGLGLGLAICVRICDLLGHKLSAKSVPGRGSTFSLSLANFRARTDAVSLASPAVRAQQSLASLRVLCVDDHIDVLDAMIALMRSWDVSCEQASGRSSALEAARIFRPDVIIVDYQFDDNHSGNGLQIIKEICDLYPEQPPAAILVTANRSVELKDVAKNLGIPLLNKPLRAARLRSLLESISRSYDGQRLQTPDDLVG